MVVLSFLVVACFMNLQTTTHATCSTMIGASSTCISVIVLECMKTSLIEIVLSSDPVLALYFFRGFLVSLNTSLVILHQPMMNMTCSLNLSLMTVRSKNVFDCTVCMSIFAVVVS